MIISENLSLFFKRILDWIIAVLITVVILGLGIHLWGKYIGISGFFKDLLGVFTTPIPVPFWVATLVGVALGISFFRKSYSYKTLFSSKK